MDASKKIGTGWNQQNKGEMVEIDVAGAWQAAAQTLGRGDPQIVYRTAQAWAEATAYLDPVKLLKGTKYEQTMERKEVVETLQAAELMDDLFDSYTTSIRDSFGLVQEIVVHFLDQYDQKVSAQEDDSIVIIWSLLHELGTILHRWLANAEKLFRPETQLINIRKTFMSSLYLILPPRFSPALTTFLRSLLHSGPSPELSQTYSSAIQTMMGLLDRYDPLLFGLIYEEIEKKVETDCKGEFEEPKLVGLLEWLTGSVLDWVSELYARPVPGGLEEAKKMLKPTFARFEYHVHKTLGLLRSTELFDIIIDYPESKAALDDLKTCLIKTDQRGIVVTRLRGLMSRRLLHPGADTKDIITQYISTIRCLRILDPPGVLLSRVADPIRKYLRDREDTIRCIVLSLIEEGNELVAELASSDARLVQDSKDEAENFNDPKWTPDPVDAPLDFRKSNGSDIIQLLVSIYDTKDVFVKELQILLAQRLLAVKNYDLDREIKNVEILKLRFGEASLQGLEVMLKDLDESKRIDHLVHEKINVPLHATIVSRLFWPSFQNTPLKPPGQLAKALSDYERSFTQSKSDKKLRWLPQLGSLNLTIELKDRSLTVDATPLQASIIDLFSTQDTWSADLLAAELLTDVPTLRNALYFWNNLGVIQCGDAVLDEWRLLEEKDSNAEAAPSHVIADEQAPVQRVDAQKIDQMRVFWQYIRAMLLNLGSMPLARIHTTLTALAPGYPGTTNDELLTFLEALSAEGLVEKSGNSWKVVK